MAETDAVLRGKVALVTGAAKRLGKAIALGLAQGGVDVVVHYGASAGEAELAVEELKALGVQAWAVQTDLSSPDATAGLLDLARDLADAPIDILVNSAGIFPSGRVLDLTLAELEENVRVNAFSPLVLCREFAAQEWPGQIVNLLDARLVDYDQEHAAYHLSKRMLFSITRMLALELAPGIRVNAVAPGLILPPPGKDDSYLAALVNTNPLLKHGCAQDVVRAVLFLLHSDFVTGQVIYVDGGRHMRGRMYGG